MSKIRKTISHCEITGRLGRSGRREVYQEKDQKIGRDVATNILPEEFVKSTYCAVWFRRVAELPVSLNPNSIAAIYAPEE
jgi:hypothetical protein